MIETRRFALTACVVLLLACACGGGLSTLRAMGKPSGEGPSQLELVNSSGVTISSVFIVPTARVDAARAKGLEPGSDEDTALWGDDYLGRESLREGSKLPLGSFPPARYDVLLVDPDGREQLVKGLKLQPGGRYVLEAGTGWRLGRL